MTDSVEETTQQVIIGTAGHIDHGKTALVKALTGVDADTLPEEKSRGITIELGFVFMDTPGFDKQIVFIDVPGHERLIRTMVAGASNIDAALLVVAADEGISAQTVEHFEILRLLGIEKGLVALTKTDIADAERVRTVEEEVRGFIAGTFLRDAPVIGISSVTGAGVGEVKSALLGIAERVTRRPDSGVFRMPIDRVFTMPGFGTVIGGTVLSGAVRVDDRVEILPEGILGRVRGIQVHNRAVESSGAGRRTAINLPDVSKDSLRRGQCAAQPGSLFPTNRLDARLHLLQGEGLKNRARVRLHIGTDEVISRVVLLDGDKVEPGGTALAQFVLERPGVALPRDRFVIRAFSPVKTIGGGMVLDARPAPHRRSDAEVIGWLEKLNADMSNLIEYAFVKSGFVPQTPEEVALSIGVRKEEVNKSLEAFRRAGTLAKVRAEGPASGDRRPSGDRYLHSTCYEELVAKVVGALEGYLEQHHYRLLMPLADLQSQFLSLTDRQLFRTVIEDLEERGTIYSRGNRIGIVGRQLALRPAEEELAQKIERAFREAGLSAPLEEEVRQQMGVSPAAFENVMVALLEQERLVRLSEKVTYHREHVAEGQRAVSEEIRTRASITVAQLRDRLGVSRKYALALLEHFDRTGFTRREGEAHVLSVVGKV